MKTKLIGIALAVCTLLALSGCREKIVIPVEKLTQDGYFTLRESGEKGRYGPVIIFPERHNSRLIQAEIGWALDILLDDCGINTIALEGMYIDETMAGAQTAYRTETEKYTVLLAALEHGDIKAPEFMYLAKDSHVFGIEDKDEYAVTIPQAANLALIQALLMSIIFDQGLEAYNRGVDSFIKDEIDLNTLLSLNPWAAETVQILNKSGSITAIASRLTELEEKTNSLLDAKTKTGIKQLKGFYETAYKRSHTMAGAVRQKLRKKNEPLAMIIGAAHTEDITAYFDKNRVRYYVLEPGGLNAADVWSDLTNEEYERKEEGKPVFINRQISGFFMNGRNFRPTYKEDWTEKQLNFTALVSVIINGASSPPPAKDFTPDMLYSNGLRVAAESIKISNPADINFYVENTRGERLYVRVLENVHGYQFGTLQNAFKDIIARLANEENMSYRERIEAYKDIVEVFNFMGCLVYISPSDMLPQIDV
ncbi:MAG: hypothetical protein LBH43_18160 [Treponema sp.]|nr:hypothetical protein [Treponema sp.]